VSVTGARARRHADEHLRRFLDARRRCDVDEMRRWWNELVVDFFERMDGFVALAHRGRLDHDEHQVAVQLSMVRFSHKLMESFEGVSMGELVNACKTLAWGICIDVQRGSIRAREHHARSLDAGWEADADERPTPSWEAGEAVRRHEREQRSADTRDFLDWALPQLPPDRRRVLELTFAGAELPEIMRHEKISRDNAYQRRSRGFRDLKKLKERYDA
jgi:hypothetical protein